MERGLKGEKRGRRVCAENTTSGHGDHHVLRARVRIRPKWRDRANFDGKRNRKS